MIHSEIARVFYDILILNESKDTTIVGDMLV